MSSTKLPAPLGSTLPFVTWWQSAPDALVPRDVPRLLFSAGSRLGRTFNFTDCAIGNLLFAGCYLKQDRDFNRTIPVFSELYEAPADVLLNITLGENLFLVAEKENGTVLRNEADIVASQDAARISELFLLDEQTYLQRVEKTEREPAGGWQALFRAAHRVPQLNPRAAEALASADVIVYGPGTQHSSLFPSYMTDGVAEAIAANTKADKVFIGNIHRDFDIQEDDASDLARKLLDTMSRKGTVAVEWSISSPTFSCREPTRTPSARPERAVDRSRFKFPLETVKVRDWEAQEGRHSGGYVLDELRGIVQSHIDVDLAQLHHMVTIIIPVLNEETTIESVLKSVTALDFQELGLSKEVLLVDGGSTDGTLERARGVRNLKVLRLEKGTFGRGAAMRLGVERARGDLIVFFRPTTSIRSRT